MANETVNALNFNGNGDYAATNLDVQPDTMPATTWEAWVKPGRLDHTDWQSILSSDDGLWDRLLAIQNGGRDFVVGTGTEAWPTATADLGVWQHVAVVYTPANIAFYKNGQETSYGFPPTGQFTMHALNLGRSPRCNQFFQGQLADVRIWKVARTAEQIREYMSQRLSGAEPGLAAYWPFETLTDNISADASGHGYGAYLVGAAPAPSDLTLAEPLPPELGAFAAEQPPVAAPTATGGALPVALVNGQYAYSAPADSGSPAADAMGMSAPAPEAAGVSAPGAQAQSVPIVVSPPRGPLGIDPGPTNSIPSSPTCTVRGKTIFEIRQMREDAKQIGIFITYEIETLGKRKAYVEQMTAYLNDRLRELNKVKKDLSDEQKWIQASNQKIAELSQKEKLAKLQDVSSCIKNGLEKMQETKGTAGVLQEMERQAAALEDNIKRIKVEASNIRSASGGTPPPFNTPEPLKKP